MFQYANKFNSLPSENIDLSNVTNMSAMFFCAWSFNQPIGSWDTSKVTNMNRMFYTAQSFNKDLTTWNVALVTDHDNFRTGASAWTS